MDWQVCIVLFLITTSNSVCTLTDIDGDLLHQKHAVTYLKSVDTFTASLDLRLVEIIGLNDKCVNILTTITS